MKANIYCWRIVRLNNRQVVFPTPLLGRYLTESKPLVGARFHVASSDRPIFGQMQNGTSLHLFIYHSPHSYFALFCVPLQYNIGVNVLGAM